MLYSVYNNLLEISKLNELLLLSFLSNLAFALLGRCMAQYIDPQMTYEEYVQKNMLGPLEMKNTGFNITSRYISYILSYG